MAHGRDPDPYERARFWGGLLLIGAAVALALLDAAPIAYSVDPVTFVSILTTGAVLLGVDPIVRRLDR